MTAGQRKAAIGGAAIALLGVFLPWLSASNGTSTISGAGGGLEVVACSLLLFILLADSYVLLNPDEEVRYEPLRVLARIAALVLAAVAGGDALSTWITAAAGSTLELKPGAGIFMTMIGAAASGIALLAAIRAGAREESTADEGADPQQGGDPVGEVR